jgi:hypothetical protein
MVSLILGILSVLIIIPLILPWDNKLLIYSVVVWLLLWLLFFLQVGKEIGPGYDTGIVSDSIVLSLSILAFTVVIAVRCLGQFIWYKINGNRNHT